MRPTAQVLLEGLPKAGLERMLPVDGAFYLYADVSRFCADSFAFARQMLEEAHVAATPGIDFDPINGQPLHPLLLCRLGRRHARGGGGASANGSPPGQGDAGRRRSELHVELLELVRLGLGGGDPFLHRRHRHDAGAEGGAVGLER